jgi:mannose-6-phosphate isomerase
VLGPNQPHQFYLGGAAIAELRGEVQTDPYRPEDWVGSTTTRWGEDDDGLSRLPDGTRLRDAVESAPHEWLGPDHVAAYGASTELLVKLLDAGQRLPVHVHPSRPFALRHLGSRHGKTESWVVLGTKGASPSVFLGWRRDVPHSQLMEWHRSQDTSAMLANMHELTVQAGDTVLVPAGTAHAISEGVFCAELQEPTDFSIMIETAGFDIDPDEGELGLGKDLALSCVSEAAFTGAQLDDLTVRQAASSSLPVADIMPAAAAEYFRAHVARTGARLPAGFAVVIVTAGPGALKGETWELELSKGQSLVVPYSAGPVVVSGGLEALWCRPPTPTPTT